MYTPEVLIQFIIQLLFTISAIGLIVWAVAPIIARIVDKRK